MAQSVDFVLNLKANVEEAMKGIKGVQEGLKQLKLPKGFESSFDKSFDNLNGLVKKFNDQLNKGVKTKGDVTGLERLTNQIDVEIDKISKDFQKLTGQEIHFKVDTTEIKNAQKELDKAIEARNKFAASQADVKIGKTGKSANNLLDAISDAAGKTKTGQAAKAAKEALNSGDLQGYISNLAIIEKYYGRIKDSESKIGKNTGGLSSAQVFKALHSAVADSSTEMENLNKSVTKAKANLETATSNAVRDAGIQAQEAADKFDKEAQAIKAAEDAQKQLANQSQSLNQNIGQLESHVAMYFSFAAILRKVTQIARKAFQTVKELDAAMVETAVVTNFDVGDMWNMLPTYTENANALGSTIKDVYEAATLYYQQGLNTAQAMGLANETLKMARIGGLEAAEATDMMTAALRGFNMQLNELSAQRINDVYSKLAAITASDTREIGSAMERTASIANSANMEFETTSAFLAQMIETTREAPENLGTAMKTIVARFQEMKQDPTKLIDSEGEMLNANKVDAALKTIGVNLMDVNGQFRDLDDVFLEISSKWGGLTQAQQRYIATIAAGSRQQSRFIAMMQNYDRTMELVEAANNSTGASQEQFDKTLEGLDAKLNKLKNAWDQFAMGLANNKIIKLAVDGMTDLFTIINKILGVLDNIPDPFGGVTKSLVTLLAVVKGMGFAGTILTGGVRGLGGWARGEEKFRAATPFGSMKKGISLQFEEARTAKNNAAARRAGAMDGEAYKKSFIQKIREINIGQAVTQARGAVGNSNANARILLNKLYPSGNLNAESRKKALEIINRIQNDVQSGLMSSRAGLNAMKVRFISAHLDASKIDSSSQELQNLINTVESGQQAFTTFGAKVNTAGSFLQNFGMIIGGPVGNVLSTIGFALLTVGGSLTKVITSTIAATAAALAHAAGIKKENAELIKQKILNGEISKQNYGKMFQNLFGKASGEAGGGMQAIGKTVGTLLKHLLKLAKPLLIIAGIAAALYGIYRVVKADEIALNKAGKAAGAAADAYSSAAQATSELRDNLAQLEEAQSGFDGLVEGTAAFNEQLIKSNELVVELLKKYPMLYDYLKTEDNGRMTISDEGMKAVLDYQKEITSQAAALSTITNGEYRAKQSEQEEDNLRKERDKVLRTFNGTQEERATLVDTYDKELELLDKQQETYRQSSKATAVTTALSDKELNNQKAITQLYSDQYDLRKSGVKLSKKEAYQAYADFYGYDYRGKKLYDLDGNEVNVDKKDVQAVAEEISVLTTFETDAESLNNVINYANDYFKENFNWDPFGNIEGKDTFISDLLSKDINANEDVIQEVLNDATSLEKTAEQLSADQISKIMGVSLDTVQSDLEGYREKVVDLLEQNAKDIAKAQAQNYADLGIMIGKAYDTQNVGVINGKLRALNQKQRQSILQAAQGLEKAAGEDSMEAVIRNMSNVYIGKNTDAINEMQKLIDGVNWDSAIDRLGTYNKLIESGNEQLRIMGEELKNSSDESSLVVDAFEELYSSTDFTKATEDLSKYTDGLGHIDASGIKELSKESNSLNNLLKTGEITTGGMAKVMNLLHDNADLTFLDMNDDLIKLLNNLGQVDTLLGEAHNTIENFDPGLDTGEAGDFFTDSVEKYNEFFENGEWGNPQMRAYAEFIVGEDNFIAKLKENNGDLKKTYEDFNDIINEFATGGYDVWERVANATGGAADRFSFDENGSLQIDLTGITSIEDIIDDFAEAAGISKEGAQVALELFSNYSPDFQSQMEAVAAYNTFNEDGRGYLKNKVTEEGRIVLLQSDLEKFALALGLDANNGEDIEELKNTIAGAIGETSKIVDVIQNTGENASPEQIAQEYSRYMLGDENAKRDDWIKQYIDEEHNNSIDVKEALAGLKEFNFTNAESMGMLWNAFKDSNQDFTYNGIKLDRNEITSQEEFEAAFAEAVEAPDWVNVGELIAQGFWQYENQRKAEESSTPSTLTTDSSSSTGMYKDQEHGSQEAWDSGTASIQKIIDFFSGLGAGNESSYGWKNGDKDEIIRYQWQKHSKSDPLGEEEVTIPVNLDDSSVDSEINEIKEKIAQETVTLDIDSELTGADLREQLSDAGFNLDEEQVITFVAATDDGSFQQVEVNLNDIPEDVPVTAYLEDYFTEPTNIMISSFNGSSVGIEDYAIDNYTEPTGQMIQDFWGANVGIEDWMIDNFTGPTNDAIAGFAGAYVSIPVNMYLTEQAQALVDKLGNMGGSFGVNGALASLKGLFNVTPGGATISKGGGPLGGPSNNNAHSSIPTNTRGGSGGGSGGSGGGGGGGGGSDKHQTINNWSIEEVIRFDAEKKIDNYQHKVDNWMKDLEKSLDKIGTRVSDVTSNLNNQIDYLKSVERQNNNLAASYQRSLNQIDKGDYKVTISYDKNGESQQEDVNLSPYIYKDQWDNYQIDKSKIAGAGSKARQEAIFKAAQSAIDPLVSGLQKAQDGARAARDAIEDLQKQIYNTFYGWENEITKIYNLTQKISNLTGMQERFVTQVNLELTKLGVGYGSTIDSIVNITAVLNRNNDALVKTVKANKELIKARQEELANAISSTDELDHYTQVWKNAGRTMNDAGVQLAKQEWDAANMALSYISSKQFNEDGTIEIEINTKKFENDVAKGLISEKTYEAIKKHLDNIENAAKEVNNIIKDSANILVDYYNKLEEYQKTIGDFENVLLKQLEDNLKTQIDNSKKLNNSLKNSLKNILDEVKRRLNERRQKEDNAQTEADIAKKQQQLAMLRANTSAGNKVEIARLEKEIADAQQSYQRTLEDQLLQKLQEQEDIAATQRERQIELLEAQLELDKERNRQLVTTWLKDPTQYQEEIRKLWLESQDYEDKGDYNREILEKAFDKAFTEYLNAATQSNFTSSLRSQLNIQQTIADRVKEIEDLLKFVTELNTNGEIGKTILNPHTAKYFKDNENSINEALKASESEGHRFTDKELVNGGYTIRDFIKAGIKDRQRLLNAGFDEKTVNQYVPKQKTSPKKTTSNTKTNSTTNKSTTPTKKTYSEHGGSLPASYPGYFSSNYTTKIQQFLKAIGLYKDKIDGSYGPNTRSATKAFQRLVGLTVDGSFGPDTLKKAKLYKYKKGGLAPFTGPAWLDGTKSKPELVLNATDTKNFIQLKDILSSIMKGGVFDTAAAVAGDTNYEININVDHIENDYDVDKIANRVKKIIVQDSSYRNVTSVRKFR